MSEWQDRVRAERNELKGRLAKLALWISGNPVFRELKAKDKALLRRQRDTM